MVGTRPENVVWGTKQVDRFNTIIATGELLYKGRRFRVEESGIFESKAYVRVSPESHELTNVLISQIEQTSNITVNLLSKELKTS